MLLSKSLLLSAILALSVLYSSAQTKTLILPNPEPPPPGNMLLLPDYIFTAKRGIDSFLGTIGKKDGLQIEYAAGNNMGDFASDAYYKERANVDWRKRQYVNNRYLTLVCFKNGKIYATFNQSKEFPILVNFYSTVKNNEELTDFLLMIMTYNSRKLPMEQE